MTWCMIATSILTASSDFSNNKKLQGACVELTGLFLDPFYTQNIKIPFLPLHGYDGHSNPFPLRPRFSCDMHLP